jgi:phosphatidylglycerophosphate synthase
MQGADAEVLRASPAPSAIVYAPDADSRRLAAHPVAGRSLTLRAAVTALRGGATVVGIPTALREARLERELRRLPDVASAIRWLTPGTAIEDPIFADRSCLLLPVTTLLDPPSVRALRDGGSGGSVTVLDQSAAAGAPAVVAPPNLVAKLWGRLSRGDALGDELARYVEATAPVAIAPVAPVVTVRRKRDLDRAEAALYRRLGTSNDSGVDNVLHRRCSVLITRLLVRTSVTPNQVSLASLAIGAGAIWSFWNATPASGALGIVLYALACIVDHSDGELARLTFEESRFGAHLDWAIDTLIHSLLILAMGLSAGGGPIMVVVGAVGGVGVTLSALCARYMSHEIEVGPSVGGVLKNIGNRDLFYFLLLLFVVFRALMPMVLPALALVVAVGSQSYWIACLSRIRAARGAEPGA